MKKIYLYLIPLILVFAPMYNYRYIRQQLDAYAIQSTQELLGSDPLAPEQEVMVKAIAQEMGVTDKIIIRKMNWRALQAFGYHNAFAYFPLFLNVIPYTKQPFLFFSEGFLEDLSPEEQRFLIGHEMVHIKERHLLYLNLVMYLCMVLLALGCWLLFHYVKRGTQKYAQRAYYSYILNGIFALLFYCCILLPTLGALVYRRYMERLADCESLVQLHSYDGCKKLLDRWQKEHKIPRHHNGLGLFEDHPSCCEREEYCLELENKAGKAKA